MHYLKAVQATGTDDADAVMKKMKATPINDMFAKGGKIREDGRMVHDMYLVEVKKPGRVEGAVGLLQREAGDSRRRGLPADVAVALSAGQEVS